MNHYPLNFAAVLASIAAAIDTAQAVPIWSDPTSFQDINRRAEKETTNKSTVSATHTTTTTPNTTKALPSAVPEKKKSTPTEALAALAVAPPPTTTTTTIAAAAADESKETIKSATQKSLVSATPTLSTIVKPTSSSTAQIPKFEINSKTPSAAPYGSSIGLSAASSTHTPNAQVTAESYNSSSGLSSSAIGGIVAVAGVAIVGVMGFTLMHYKKKRNALSAATPDPFTMGFGNNTIPKEPTFQSPAAYATMTPTLVPVATPLASHTEKKLPNHLPPVITEQTQPGSVGVFTVVSSYTPTLSDELDIEVGDRIEIFSIYDDGWCQGINLTSGSSKGVFPKHCTDYASATIHDKTMSVVSMDLGKGKRVSSMYIKKPL